MPGLPSFSRLGNSEEKPVEQHINFITLGVADLAVSRRFYREAFGWQETAGSDENIAFFQAGGVLLLALFGKDALAADAQVLSESSGFNRFTLAHNVGSGQKADMAVRTFKRRRRTGGEAATTGVLGRIQRLYCRPRRLFMGNCL